ncbi:MAG TPA: cytochrome P450 [Pseudonocardia sp.]|jgi:cytochrome P450|nr:cytochrome P450 [Pseudonocardia sp.]
MSPLERDYRLDYDLGEPELNERWDDVVADLHDGGGCPVARSDVGEGYWIVNRYDDVVRCAKDWQTFTASSGFMVNRPEGLPYFAPGEADPPLHAQLRAALDPFLRPSVVRGLQDTIRATADALIDKFIADGHTDVVASFANPLPQAIFSVELAGMDPADMPFLLKTFSLSGPMEERGPNFAKGMAKIEEYLRRRSQDPSRGDIVDALLAFEHPDYGWTGKVGTLSQLTIGGIGTTGYVFAGGLHHLATHPIDRRLLIEDPDRIGRALDEFLRFYMGAPNMARRATVDVELGGTPIRAGDRVLLSFGAASRDPAVTERPNVVDITRRQVRHLAFGAGNHRCIGASLARPILKIGFEQFLRRIPDFAVPDGFEPRHETGNTRHMLELPLLFTPGSRSSSDVAVEVST